MNKKPIVNDMVQTTTIDSSVDRIIPISLPEPVRNTRLKKRRQLALIQPKAAVDIIVMAQYTYIVSAIGTWD